MKLCELDPKLDKSGFLRFDCPVCSKNGNTHGIRVPLAPALDGQGHSWQYTGEFPNTLSLMPSIDVGCWHGFITNGEII